MAVDTELYLRTHGDHQLELTAAYPLSPGRQKLSLYLCLFVPSQLEGDSRRVEDLYRGLKIYCRYRTPAIPLNQILRKNCPSSPLFRIRKIFKKTGNYHLAEDGALVSELRALLNLLEHHNNSLKGMTERGTAELLLSFPGEMKEIQVALDDFAPQFLHPDSSSLLKEAFEVCREGVSLHIEKAAGRIYHTLSLWRDEKENMSPGVSEKIIKNGMKECIKHVRQQQEYRLIHGYIYSENSNEVGRNTEEALFREHEIKKWGQQTLYINSESSTLIARLVQIFFGVAAAAAMSLAVLATVLSLKFFESGSLAWALVAVTVYILKDRVKDGLRAFFLHFIPNWYADRIQKLINPGSGRKGGSFKEQISFPESRELPPEILASAPAVKEGTFLIQYRKVNSLKGKVLLEGQEDITSLADILRLDVQGWLSRMDKARETVYSLREDALVPEKVSRTYRIPVLAALYRDGFPIIRSYSVVLDARGIKRVEESPQQL
ncbi:MAG: hypothetical protein PQJ50_15245 [Spirochaetales bacterium]|nr:hypothetical protein [Spirochaetales bacterium]